MRICLISQQLKKTISGVGLYTNLAIHYLVQAGHALTVLVPASQVIPTLEQVEFVTVADPIISKNQARWLPLAWSFGKAIRALQADHSFDLYHFTDARESLFAPSGIVKVGNVNDTYSAELHTLRYYHTHYDDWAMRSAYYHLVHACENYAYPRLNAVIANSNFTARTIDAQYAISPEQLFICHKSIDRSFYQPAYNQRGQNAHRPLRVLFAGTNMQRKGLPLVIQAAGSVIKELPSVEFWVVGDDPALPKMKALCREAGVETSFTFLGWKPKEDLMKIYAQCDIFVMPSLTEAFGVVFLEAMAAGVVPIGTKVGGIPEIIEDGVNGFLIEPGHADQLAERILTLMLDDTSRERMQLAGLQTVEKFSAQRMMECTTQIYQSVLPGSMV